MAFREISSLDADTVISLGGFNKKLRKDNPTKVEGYYLGSRQIDSPKSANGKAYIHIFQTEKGNLGVWGKTDLDKKILQVTPGTMTQATFSGMKPTKNGEMYTFKVAVDTDNVIEVAANNSSNATDDNSSDDVDQSFDDRAEATFEGDSEQDEPVVEVQAKVTQTQADRAAKVAALLKGKKAV